MQQLSLAETIDEIKNSFKFNDSIIRNLVLSVKKVHKDTSALLLQTKEDNEKDTYQEAREAAKMDEERSAQEASKTEAVEAKEEVKADKESAETEQTAEEPVEEIKDDKTTSEEEKD